MNLMFEKQQPRIQQSTEQIGSDRISDDIHSDNTYNSDSQQNSSINLEGCGTSIYKENEKSGIAGIIDIVTKGKDSIANKSFGWNTQFNAGEKYDSSFKLTTDNNKTESDKNYGSSSPVGMNPGDIKGIAAKSIASSSKTSTYSSQPEQVVLAPRKLGGFDKKQSNDQMNQQVNKMDNEFQQSKDKLKENQKENNKQLEYANKIGKQIGNEYELVNQAVGNQQQQSSSGIFVSPSKQELTEFVEKSRRFDALKVGQLLIQVRSKDKVQVELFRLSA
ncbi:MAG: hypothetical protein EZS28_039878 [Streblomastix strix]|uniref:Uncharacterized protein n=1 Tax=Streblomastix strix TaxID=222440 RepID=A0A5J4U4L0_9EUKA|nr:MAG: hypothetical protein EZS28_039878 [Streblomastix strix]